MVNYKLTYFNGRGRAEVARQLLKFAEQEFEDVRVEFGEPWAQVKPSTPFGQLPMLEVDGVKLCQSSCMERLLAKRFKGITQSMSMLFSKLAMVKTKRKSHLYCPELYGADDMQQAHCDMVVSCGEDMLRAMIKTSDAPDKEAEKKKCEEETLPTMLSNLEKMVSNDGFFLGRSIMWADLSIAHILTFGEVYGLKVDICKYSKLSALKSKVESHPKISAWSKARPHTEF